MRVEQIRPLASFTLSGDPERDVAMLEDAIAKGETRHFDVSDPLPVYVLYWTAQVDDEWNVHLYTDVYGDDEKLIAARDAGVASKRIAVLSAP